MTEKCNHRPRHGVGHMGNATITARIVVNTIETPAITRGQLPPNPWAASGAPMKASQNFSEPMQEEHRQRKKIYLMKSSDAVKDIKHT